MITDAYVESEPQEAANKPRITSVAFKELTKDDIRTVVEQFAAGADRAKRAGLDAVRFTDNTGTTQAIAADHVVVAKGVTGNPVVADQMRQAGFKAYAFGDCTGVGYIEGAIRGAVDAVAAAVNDGSAA